MPLHFSYWIKNGSVLISQRFLSTILYAITSLVFANFLSKEDFGTYKYIFAIIGILNVLTLPDIGTALIQSIARNQTPPLGIIFEKKLKRSLLASIACIFLSGFFLLKNNSILGISFLILTFFLPLYNAFSIYDALLQGKKLFIRSYRYSLFVEFTCNIILILTVILSHKIPIILLVFFASYTVLRAIFFIKTLKEFPTNNTDGNEVINYGKHLNIMRILATVSSYADEIITFHFLGAPSLAIYAIVTAIPEQIKSILGTLYTLAFPKFSEAQEIDIRKNMKTITLFFFLIGIFFIGLYILTAPYIFKVFFSNYMDIVFLSQLFAISMLNIAFTPVELFLKSKKKVKELYLINIITSIFQIFTITLFIIYYGLIGLVISRIMCRFLSGILCYYFYQKTRHHEITVFSEALT